ncbi:MAG: hypothetical protein KGJ86_15625 [Chloroflexota bacterium]|nr:hypothetical protein [Chloroflexota bacterium]
MTATEQLPSAPPAVPAAAPAAPAAAGEPGPLSRLMHAFLPHAEPGGHDAEQALARLRDEYRAHAKDVFYVTHLALTVAGQVDPKDAPAVSELEQKALSLAVRAASMTAAILAA